jgi:NhaA family Na+:H+ antiporter
VPTRPRPSFAEFLREEAAGGVLLVVATLVALTWANSPWSGTYDDLWGAEIGPSALHLRLDLGHWVTDGLMTVFFLVIGLELRRELTSGELGGRTIVLPVAAAIGGMVVPAALYLVVAGGGEAAGGWGIPMATDVAFVLGVLVLLGRRVPAGLRVFLLTLAVVDDIGAILVIAVFYGDPVQLGWVVAAAAALAAAGVTRARLGSVPILFGVAGIAIWYLTFRSGVHPALAGVALGLLVPSEHLERRLHPISSRVVVPLFALANAGVALGADAVGDAASGRVAWAVAIALVVGKAVGVAVPALVGRRAGIGSLPDGVDTRAVIGGATLAGIGFTVSLFVTHLAFDDPALVHHATIGVLAGSALSAAIGYAFLARRARSVG